MSHVSHGVQEDDGSTRQFHPYRRFLKEAAPNPCHISCQGLHGQRCLYAENGRPVQTNSKLAGLIDNKLIMDLKHEGDMWDIAPNNSTTIYLILLQGLAISIAKNIGVRLCDFKMNHPGGGIGKKLRMESNV